MGSLYGHHSVLYIRLQLFLSPEKLSANLTASGRSERVWEGTRMEQPLHLQFVKQFVHACVRACMCACVHECIRVHTPACTYNCVPAYNRLSICDFYE